MRYMPVLVVSAAFLLSAGADAQDSVTLVPDGRPQAAIILPAEPQPGEKKAAEELQTYIKKASGAELPIRTEAEDTEGARLILGRAAKSLEAKPTGDGFAIETHGNAILIAGGNERGTLYGAYAFLEGQLGVRWFMPGDVGEVVPAAKTITIPPLSRREQPDFEYRWIGRNDDWVARNRNNVDIPEIGIHIYRSAHTFRKFLDPKQYFEEHPEWFALVNGERRRFERSSHRNQICTSNPQAIQEVIKNMRQFLDENPEYTVVTLFPNDGMGFCECENCKALDEPGWATVEEANRHARALGFRALGVLSRRLTIFNNAVAKAIYETHPHVMVKVGAYSCYCSPPKDKSLKHFKNIIVQICHSWCQNHAIADPNCPINADFKNSIEGWSAITPGGVMLYEYYWKCAQCELPFPIIHAMRQDYPYFKEIGVKGVFTQYTTNWGTLTLPYYMPTRLLWNADADVDKLLEDFYTKFYGSAAAPMKRYYERLEKAAVDSGLHFSPPYFRFPEVFTDECLQDCQRFIDEAKGLADGETIRKRIDIVQLSLDYTKLVMDYVNAVRAVDQKAKARWQVAADPGLFDEAKAKAEVIDKFRSRPEMKTVIRRNNKYVDRLLNPAFTFLHRYDKTDTRQLEQRGAGLTKRKWMETAPKHDVAGVPDTFDLWVYGHDFDADADKSEHEVFLISKDGKRVPVGPLPPKGQDSDRKASCVVFRNVAWPDEGRDVLRIEVINPPEDWTASTLLAVYMMPPGLDVSPEKAARLIADHAEWSRRNSLGFFEAGYRGIVNRDGEATPIEIEILGAPKGTIQVPK